MEYVSNKVLLLNLENEKGNVTMKNIVDVAVTEMSVKLNKGFKSNFDQTFRTTEQLKKDIDENEKTIETNGENFKRLKWTCDSNFEIMVKQEEFQKTVAQLK